MSRLFLPSSLPRPGAGSGAGGCPGPGSWGAGRLAAGLGGWGALGGGPSREVAVGLWARVFPGPSLSGLLAPWQLETRYPPEPLPQWGVCEVRRWDRDKAAPTSLVLGLGDGPGGRKIDYPAPTPENPFEKLTRCVTPISMPRRAESCWLAAAPDTPRASRGPAGRTR